MSFRVLPLRFGGPIRRHGSHIFLLSVFTTHRIEIIVKLDATLHLADDIVGCHLVNHKIKAPLMGT